MAGMIRMCRFLRGRGHLGFDWGCEILGKIRRVVGLIVLCACMFGFSIGSDFFGGMRDQCCRYSWNVVGLELFRRTVLYLFFFVVHS